MAIVGHSPSFDIKLSWEPRVACTHLRIQRLFLGNNDIAGWQTAVEQLAAELAYETILPGHGLPADRGVFAEPFPVQLLGDDGEAYKNAILERYPDRRGPFLIDIGNQYLCGSQAG